MWPWKVWCTLCLKYPVYTGIMSAICKIYELENSLTQPGAFLVSSRSYLFMVQADQQAFFFEAHCWQDQLAITIWPPSCYGSFATKMVLTREGVDSIRPLKKVFCCIWHQALRPASHWNGFWHTIYAETASKFKNNSNQCALLRSSWWLRGIKSWGQQNTTCLIIWQIPLVYYYYVIYYIIITIAPNVCNLYGFLSKHDLQPHGFLHESVNTSSGADHFEPCKVVGWDLH